MQQFMDELFQGLSPDGTPDPFAPDGGTDGQGSMTVSIDLSTTRLAQVRHELGRVIVGQDRVVDRLLVAVLADGHVLLEGAPGLGKTLLLATLARILGGSFNRIQFTPDLIPSDIVGTRIFRPSSEAFDVEPGPIMANIVLVDEINRAPARVQSALLEAMAERQVTVGGRTFAMPQPFLVVATQNPVESEGVYPLAEAQRDRFLMRVPVDYPTPTEERAIVARMADEPPQAARLLDAADVVDLQMAARRSRGRRGSDRLRDPPGARDARPCGARTAEAGGSPRVRREPASIAGAGPERPRHGAPARTRACRAAGRLRRRVRHPQRATRAVVPGAGRGVHDRRRPRRAAHHGPGSRRGPVAASLRGAAHSPRRRRHHPTQAARPRRPRGARHRIVLPGDQPAAR